MVQDLWQQTKHRKGLLRRLRDQAVFHHDDQVFREGSLRLEAQAEGFEFVSYQGSVEQTYFAFVDQVIMQYAVGEGAIVEMSNAEFLKQLDGAVKTVSDVAVKVANAVESVIVEHLMSNRPPG